MDLADIKYNFWIFLVKNDLSISKRRKLRRFIFKCWAEANVEGERYEKFFNESNQIELDKEFHISMSNMLFVQAGARKHVIWTDEL